MSRSWHLSVLVVAVSCVLVGAAHQAVTGTAVFCARAATTPGFFPGDSAPSSAESADFFLEPEFIGTYRPDGRFKAHSRLTSLSDSDQSDRAPQPRERPAEVPRWIDLHNPNESVRQDYAPPAHARKAVKRRSTAGSVLESIVVLLYGREAVLRAPTHVAVDPQHRLVVTDPDAPAIHVLDGRNSLRIAGGPGRRLQHPNGIALDADGNIYVADGKLGVVLVYDPGGRFLRVLGSFRGESMFQNPTGIAIDPKAGRLYVLDSPADELIVLDLQGNVVKRAGGFRKTGGVTFDDPTEIALRDNWLVVLDEAGSRIQIFDLQCRFLRGFRIRNVTGRPAVAEIGLELDSAGTIYLSNAGSPSVRLYEQSGRLIGSFGRLGQRDKEFNGPSGLWIDSTDRIYVADTYNSRIQVFQRSATAAAGKTMPPPQTRSGFSASTQ